MCRPYGFSESKKVQRLAQHEGGAGGPRLVRTPLPLKETCRTDTDFTRPDPLEFNNPRAEIHFVVEVEGCWRGKGIN